MFEPKTANDILLQRTSRKHEEYFCGLGSWEFVATVLEASVYRASRVRYQKSAAETVAGSCGFTATLS